MQLTFAYGKSSAIVNVSEDNLLAILAPNETSGADDASLEIKNSLKNPIGTPRLKDIVHPGEKIAIITSDITRPLPSYKILPYVLDELYDSGIKAQDIVIVFGLGSHRGHTEQEMRKLVGDSIYESVKCIDSIGDFIHTGTTSRGTPVDIFAPVVNADRRICLGNIEFHYFAGYSGGAKAIMPGVSTRDAIQSNHSRMVEQAAKAGALEGNPVREDIEEAANFISIDFIINVVLDEHKNIKKCVSGHHVKAHREGCKFLDKMYKVKIPQRADIVIVSPGGYPKDINLYQAQKALDNAKHAVKSGGTIIWLAAAKEGLGEHCFEKWLLGHDKPNQMIEHIKEDFQLGGHKAAAIAMVLEGAGIDLISELEDDFVRSIHLNPSASLQEAYDAAIKKHGKSATLIAMPYGGSTLPYCD